MFEIGTTDYLWQIAKKYPVLSNQPNTLKPLGYAHMINLIESFDPKTILEVGHGGGSFLFKLFKEKKEMWGLDDILDDSQVNPRGLQYIKNINPEVKFIKGLLGTDNKELPDNYFDMVCSVSVIEHIPHENLNSVFEETFRILKPGGIAAHSYDVYYTQDTKPVFDAFEKNKFEWLKSRESMNVIWESWLNDFKENSLENLFSNIVFENPLFVAEYYMWQLKRELRPTPQNFMTILTAARKPISKNLEKEKKTISGFTDLFKTKSEKFISPESIDEFTYSKKSHFELFKKNNYDIELLKKKTEEDNCDIKVYQDLLIYSFIKQNIKKGSKILDVGGSNSRILKYFKDEYECWNIDMLNKSGKMDDGIIYVNDHLGNFSKDLPDNYFDFVFSISTFMHGPIKNTSYYENILKDNDRISKKSGFSLHCFVLIFKEPLIEPSFIFKYFMENQKLKNKPIPFFKITIDSDLYYMSEKYYIETWQKSIGKTYEKFGKPFSYNILWEK